MKSSRESSKSKSISNVELPITLRFYIYALHGIVLDVFYFSILDSVNKRELYLTGRTNLLIAPIYGFGLLLQEWISPHLQAMNVSIYIRGLAYTAIAYTFEFSTGYFLSMIGQSYWDYSDYSYNFKGIIIPYTAPAWFLFVLISEKYIINGIRRLRLVS